MTNDERRDAMMLMEHAEVVTMYLELREATEQLIRDADQMETELRELKAPR